MFAGIGFVYAQETLMIMGTATTGGTSFMIGSIFCDIISNNNDAGISIRPQVTGGTVDDILLIEKGDVELGVIQFSQAYHAYEGILQWEGRPQKNLRAITRTTVTTLHLITRKAAGIKSLEDLRGTRGSPGPPGSGSILITEHVLESVGLTLDDVHSYYTDYSNTAALLKDGHMDWAKLGMGIPGSTIMDLAASTDITILPVGGARREKIMKKHPYSYIKSDIPGGIYKGIDEDVESIGWVMGIMVDESVPEDVVYNITKTIYENIEEINKRHSALKDLSVDNSITGLNVPLHPGAERYYREVGRIK